MPNSFTQVFGGTTIYPADVSYLALALTANTSLEWPLEATAGSTVVARIIDITPTGSYTITMPEATSVSVGQTVLFNNIGPNTVFIVKADGGAILSIAAGEQWQAYLINNSTVGGTWRTLRYGASTAQAQAAALAGPGLVTDGSQLAQNYEVIDFSVTPYTLTAPDRAKVFIWDGGLGTLNLPSAPSAGDGWFVQVRNAGQGDLTIDPSGSELINAGSTLNLQPGDSAVIVSNGTQWYTIGLGQQAVFAFDYTSIAVTGGTYTLSGSELNRIAYKFTGTLVSNVTIVVPATVQQYWVNNATTGSFTLSLRAAGSGTSTPVTQASTSILYCDGTDIIPATTAVTFAGILPVTQGGTGANNAASARTNLGATGIGSSLFTAVSEAAARSAISAAKSGANSDITSLTGLTTPLSVPQGGTGAATLAANGVLLGNGTSAIQATAVGATGQVLVGNTGAAPSWAALSGIGVTSLSFGSTGLTPATATTGAITVAGTLGVANGGTGTATAFTAGSVVFAGASGVYSQDNTNLFWDDTNNNLGVGTATPTTILQASYSSSSSGIAIAGTIPTLALYDSSGTTGTGYLAQFNTGTFLFNKEAGALAFGTTNIERMRIDASGQVGIGTTSPQSLLDVTGIINATVPDAVHAISLNGTTGNVRVVPYSSTYGGSVLIGYNAGYTGYGNFSIDAATVRLWTAGSERVRVDVSGNVGIGTTTPSTKLHVFAGQATITSPTASATSFANREDGLYFTRNDLPGIWRNKISNSWSGTPSNTTMNFELATGSSTNVVAMTLTAAGNVGIGTSTPAYKLDVVGSSNTQIGVRTPDLDAGSNASPIYQSVRFFGYAGTERARITGIDTAANNTNGQLAFWTGQGGTMAEAMRINAIGNVGIGTNNPTEKLVVASNTGTSGLETGIGLTNTVDSNLFLRVSGSANADKKAVIGPDTSTAFVFNTAGTERMRITSAGNVGIGTASPGAKLDVRGIGQFFSGATGSFNFIDVGRIAPEARVAVAASSGDFVSGTAAGDAVFYNPTAANAWFGVAGAGAAVFTTNSTERMRILSGGAVGIGTSAPSIKLQVTDVDQATARIGVQNLNGQNYHLVAGNPGASNNGFAIFDATASATRMYLDSSGNVGIGTSTPAARLDLGAFTGPALGTTMLAMQDGWLDIKTSAAVVGSRYLYGATVYGRAFANVTGFNLDTSSAAVPMLFGTNGSERMRIDSNGNVGIGTAGQADKLFVYANSSSSAIYARQDGAGAIQTWATFGTEHMRVTAAGNLGIGTNAPSTRLHVDGNSGIIVADASATTSQVNIGVGLLTAGRPFVGTNSNTNPLEIGTRAATPTIFVANSAECMRIDSSGNVGIGVVPPAHGPSERSLDIGNTTSFGRQSDAALVVNFNTFLNSSAQYIYRISSFASSYQQLAGEHRFYTAPSGTAGNVATLTQRMTLDVSGNLGIGTSSPGAKLDVRGSLSVVGSSGVAASYIVGAIAGTSNGYEIIQSAADALTYNWRKGDNTIAMTLDSIGNLLLKASSDGTNGIIRIQNTAGTTTVQSYADNNDGWLGTVEAKRLSFLTGNTRRMCISSAGNVGIGTANPSVQFVVSNAGAEGYEVNSTGGVGGGATVSTYNRTTAQYITRTTYSSAHTWYVGTAGTTRAMDLTSAGELLVGTTAAQTGVAGDPVGITLYSATSTGAAVFTRDSVNSVLYVNNKTSSGQLVQFYNGGNQVGSITSNGTTTSYVTTSDIRLKENIANADSASVLIDAIKVRQFDWKADGTHQRYGFVAQELLDVAPEAVSQPADPDEMMGVDYSKLVPMLVKEIQSLRARVAQLEERK